MKTFLLLLPLLIVLICGCKQDEIPVSGDGLSMTIGGKVVITANDIDYYDLSTHFVYLKGNNSFLDEKLFMDSFQICANGEKIYKGVFYSWVMSTMPIGPAIYTPGMFYGNYLIPIVFGSHFDSTGEIVPPNDPRSDPRIIDALRSHNQLHAGLKCEIKTVQFNSANKVVLVLELINNDSFNYYYLDPEKMGMGLYHYFTNGLTMWDQVQRKSYTHYIQHIQPEPYDSWKMNWLSLIKSHERKTILITYTNFDLVTAGQYKLFFRFPGLAQVDKGDLVQGNGRIWLGDLDLSQNIQIP